MDVGKKPSTPKIYIRQWLYFSEEELEIVHFCLKKGDPYK